MNEALSRWREEFSREPMTAFDRLVQGTVPLGAVSQLSLGEIFDSLFDFNDAALDDVAARWLEQHVLGPVPKGISLSRWAAILDEYFRAIGTMELSKVAVVLRGQHNRLRLWLTGFYEGPDRDPEGAYLMALARAQTDEQFVPLWRRLVLRMEHPDRPYLGIGVLGFRKAPTAEGGVPSGLLRTLIELADLPEVDEMEWKNHMRSIFVAYPRNESFWIQSFKPLLVGRERSGSAKEWLESLIPPLKSNYRPQGGEQVPTRVLRRVSIKECMDWVKRVKDDPSLCETPAFQTFLNQHRNYVRLTGDVSQLSKNFNNLAMTLYRENSGEYIECALKLIDEAHCRCPYSAYNWTCYSKILHWAKRREDAIDLLWEGRYRCAWSPHVRSELADLLHKKGDLLAAEGVLREAVNQFPDNEVLLDMQANVLIDLRRVSQDPRLLQEAEDIFSKILQLKKDDGRAKGGLSRVWSMQSASTNDIKLRRKAYEVLQQQAEEGNPDAQRRLLGFPRRWEKAKSDPSDTFRKKLRYEVVVNSAPMEAGSGTMTVPEILGRAMILLWQAERSAVGAERSILCEKAMELLEFPNDTEMGDFLPVFVETKGLVLLVVDPQRALDYFTEQVSGYGRGGWIGIRIGKLRAKLLSRSRAGEKTISNHSLREHFADYVAEIFQVLSQTPNELKIREMLKKVYPRASGLAARAIPALEADNAHEDIGEMMLGSFLQARWFAPCDIHSTKDLDVDDRLKAVIEHINATRTDTFDAISNSAYSSMILSS